MVSMFSPSFLLRRLSFCIRPTMTVHPSWPSSGSSSTSSSLMVNWGFIQKVSGNSRSEYWWAGQQHNKKRLRRDCSRTYIVSAAACWHPSPPGFFKLRLCPFLELIAWEGIRGEVTNLEAGVLAQEVRKWHPVDKCDQQNEKDQRLRIGGLHQLEKYYTVCILKISIWALSSFYQNSPSSERLVSRARSPSLTYLHSDELQVLKQPCGLVRNKQTRPHLRKEV